MNCSKRVYSGIEPRTPWVDVMLNWSRTLSIAAIVALFLSMSTCKANDIYIAQAAVGANNGADCADAYAVSYFNSSSNWGTGKIAPGTTVHLCGTFNAPAGASGYLSFHGSGANGNPITLLFESGAVLAAPYWSGCAVNLNGGSYITVNGGANGTIEATANGTGLSYQQDGGIGLCSGSAVSNVTVENLTVSNIYQHTCTEPVSNCTDSGGQDTYGIQLFGGSNLTVNNNTVHDMKWAIFFEYGYGYTTSTGFLAYNNTIYNMDHGVVFGDYGFNACSGNAILSSSNSSSAIYDNDFSAMQPWDAVGDVNHHDATHLWANCAGASSSEYTGVSVYSNYFHGDAGATDNTIFGMESYGYSNFEFNNVVNVSGYSACASGAIGIWTGTGIASSNQHVFNNTISPTTNCPASVDFEETAGDVFENNLILSGNGTYVYTDGVSGDIATADYNFYQMSPGGNPFFGPPGCASGSPFSKWKSGCGFDADGRNASVALNANFTLPVGSAAAGAGTNLTSLGITALDIGAPATFGANGSCGTGCVARSLTTAWNVGAYEGTGAANSPNSPIDLVATYP